MITWLLSLLEGVGLNWLYGKAVGLITAIVAYFKAKGQQSADQAQAAKVQAIADQISTLIKAGLPVPAALEESLREESKKLISSNPPDTSKLTSNKLPNNSRHS